MARTAVAAKISHKRAEKEPPKPARRGERTEQKFHTSGQLLRRRRRERARPFLPKNKNFYAFASSAGSDSCAAILMHTSTSPAFNSVAP